MSNPSIERTRPGRPLMSTLERQPPFSATAGPNQILPLYSTLRNHPILTP